MSMLMSDWLAKASLAIHITAEDHWRAYGDSPVKVFLFSASGAPHIAGFPQRCGQEAAAEAVRASAERVGAVAIVITSLAETTFVPIAPDVFARMPLADLPTPADSADDRQCLLTVAVWPARELVKTLYTDVRTEADGTRMLTRLLKSEPTEPSRVDGLVAWLGGLLPRAGRAGGGEAR